MSFVIPFAIILGICMGIGVYPFGDQSLLHMDAYHQYGPFFMDFAIRKTTYTAETYLPYYDYTNYDKNGQQVNTPSPQISYIRRPVNAILTFGWRF